jgi:hypothetical protein
MKTLLVAITIIFGSYVNQIKSHAPLAPKAILGTMTQPVENIQNENKTVSTNKSTTVTSSGTHLLFMGIPIDGDVDSFDEKISMKDFHKTSLGGYTGRFYGQFCVAETKRNKDTGNVCEVQIRYNQSIAHYTKSDLILLYGNIVRDLKKKYPKAKCDEADSHFVLSMSQGFIECKIFSTIFGNMGGGVNLVVRYVDKTNSMFYNIPTVKRNEDDL